MSEDWRLRATCRQVGWGQAFGHEADQREFADKVCRGCPVRLDCYRFAMRVEKGVPAACRIGVFGGLLGPERQQAAREGLADCEDCGIGMVPAKSGAVCRVCLRARRRVARKAYLEEMAGLQHQALHGQRGAA